MRADVGDRTDMPLVDVQIVYETSRLGPQPSTWNLMKRRLKCRLYLQGSGSSLVISPSGSIWILCAEVGVCTHPISFDKHLSLSQHYTQDSFLGNS